jgi:hypothetical protein
MKRPRRRSWYGGFCDRCNGINEPYMVKFRLWKKVIGKENNLDIVCISCFEKLLGRKLKSEDFLNAPINKGFFGFESKLYCLYGKAYLNKCKEFFGGRK